MGKGYSLKMKTGSATEADLFVYEDVGAGFFGGVTAKDVADDLKAIGAVKTINVHINSGGGDVFDGVAIHNQLKAHPARIVVHVDGLAASIASVIAMAGDEIRISESGFIMIHNASGVVIGEAGDMRKMADVLEKVQASIIGIYAERTGQAPDALQAMMDAETWFTGDEAVSAGFADQMVANMHLAARVDPIKHQFKHTPAALSSPPPANHVHPRLRAASEKVAAMQARILRTPLRSA
jgi:ATP-dependent Clp protease protease subunit